MTDNRDGAIARIMKGLVRSNGDEPLPTARLADIGKARAEVILTSEQSDALRNFLKMLTRQS